METCNTGVQLRYRTYSRRRKLAADAFSRLCDRAQTAAEFNADELVIPENIKRTLRSVHNSICGHNGVEKTLQKLTEKGVAPWKYMREHVNQYIHNCPVCQKLDFRNVKNHTAPFTTSSQEPMRKLSVDSIGPLPPDRYGNCYVMVVIDNFTRFVELYAIPDVTAKFAAQALLQQIGRYGAPELLHSDRGSQFVNETISELMKLVGTEHCLSLADSKEENGIVERANKEVMRHLRAILLDIKGTDDWSIYLPLVQRIMNASEHSAIGMSPAQLIFGNAITLDKGIFLPHKKGYHAEEEPEILLSEWASKMVSKQAELIRLAQAHQQATNDIKIVQANPQRTEFPINSYVLVKYRDRPPTKFHTNWRGPMRVVHFNKSLYTLQDLVTNKLKNFHITQLKPFIYDEMEVDPSEVARAEQHEFLVENILEHRVAPEFAKKRTHYEFLVKWTGYDHADNTWEPWETVRDNEQLNRYLYAHQLKQFLTKTQKDEVAQYLAGGAQ